MRDTGSVPICQRSPPSLRAKRSNPSRRTKKRMDRNDAKKVPSHSRGAMRPRLADRFALDNRGRREYRMRAAPAVSRAKCTKSARMSIEGSGEQVRYSPVCYSEKAKYFISWLDTASENRNR